MTTDYAKGYLACEEENREEWTQEGYEACEEENREEWTQEGYEACEEENRGKWEARAHEDGFESGANAAYEDFGEYIDEMDDSEFVRLMADKVADLDSEDLVELLDGDAMDTIPTSELVRQLANRAQSPTDKIAIIDAFEATRLLTLLR